MYLADRFPRLFVLVSSAALFAAALAGCTWDQATPYVAAGCAAGQIAASTASLNAAALNKPKVAAYIAQGQQLAASDCTAAMAMIQAAKAAAAPAATAPAS